MIFQKPTRKSINCTFYIGNEVIEVTQNYRYLGNRISSTGNFALSLDHFKEKAMHTFFSIRKHTNFSRSKDKSCIKNIRNNDFSNSNL